MVMVWRPAMMFVVIGPGLRPAVGPAMVLVHLRVPGPLMVIVRVAAVLGLLVMIAAPAVVLFRLVCLAPVSPSVPFAIRPGVLPGH